MKTLLLVLALIGSTALPAQEPPLKSGVYHWSELKPEPTDTGEKRLFVKGSTLDMDFLEIQGITLKPGQASLSRPASDEHEELIIVKEGTLKVTLKNQSKVVVGAGSVAIAIPGEECRLENATETPVVFYLFRYKSKAGANAERGKGAGGSFVVDWSAVPFKPSALGGRRDNFDRATTLFRRFEMHASTLNASLQNHATHTHRAEEMVLVIRGEVEMLIGETQYKAAAGDLFFLASQIPHSLRNIGKEQTEYFAFQWQ